MEYLLLYLGHIEVMKDGESAQMEESRVGYIVIQVPGTASKEGQIPLPQATKLKDVH